LVCVVFRRKFGEWIFGSHPHVTTGGTENAFSIPRLLAIWIVVIVGFYSLSRNQQDQYVMPTFLAVAVLVGALMDAYVEMRADGLRWSTECCGRRYL